MKVFLMWVILGSGQTSHQVLKEDGEPFIIDDMWRCVHIARDMKYLEDRMPHPRRTFYCSTRDPMSKAPYKKGKSF